jgi:hypothetical protein
VCELDGPIPILKRSNTLSNMLASRASHLFLPTGSRRPV